jgi:NADPH:quinone reductase
VRAIHVTRDESGSRLCVVEIPEPDSAGKVVIAVESAGVSQPDVLQISGRYQNQRPLPFVPGAEAVGTVLSAPAGMDDLVGQRVVALTPEGAWQERVAVSPPLVFPIPAGVSATQASLLLVNYVAAHFGLVQRGRARAGEILLVHGAAGGIGGAAVQIGAALGLTTIAVTSTEEKAAYATTLGAAAVVAASDWKSALEEVLENQRVDLVFDPVAGERFDDNLRVLGPGGRILVIGFLGGEIPQVKINRLLLQNVSVVGVAAGAYMMHDPAQLQRSWSAIEELLISRAMILPEPTTFPISRAEDAVAAVRDRRAVGKVAVIVGPEAFE